MKVPGMIISPEEKKTLCKQMRAKINKEGTMLDLLEGEVISSETHRKIWECTCQQIMEPYDEADLDRLLTVVRQLLPSLSVWGDKKKAS